jgi:acyl-CoA synthetase (NDP forming)
VPGEVALAIIAVPAVSVPATLEQCGRTGVGSAVIFSAGFAETSNAGQTAQEGITALARRTGIRILPRTKEKGRAIN